MEKKDEPENIKLTNSLTKEIKEDFKLKFEINKWEQKTNKTTKKLEVIFNIELYSELASKKWNVYHSIQDFKDLLYNLSEKFPNLTDIIPNLKSLEKGQGTSSMITKISSAILEFLNNISHRSDIINSNYYINFFHLENHFGDSNKNEPIEKNHITGLNYEVSDMVILEKKDLLIVGCGQVNSNVLSKMNFWSKKENKGELNIYKINYTKDKGKGHVLFAKAGTESEISCLCITKDTNDILIGYSNGTVELFEMPEYDENNNEIIKLVPKNKIEINTYKNRIINIGYNSTEKSFYCACFRDKMIYNAKISGKNVDLVLPGSDEDLCGFYYLENYQNLKDFVFEIDVNGKIYIGIINKLKKCVHFNYVLDQKINHITLFKVDLEYNHIYVGNKNGNIDIYLIEISPNENNTLYNQFKVKKILNISLNNDNKGKLTNMLLRNFPYKVNDICYNPKRKEILVALDNGTIQVFSHFKNFPEFVLYELNKDNKKENITINKLYFSKLNSILYLGRSEKDILIYQMPDNYNSEISRRLRDTNSFEILDGNKICKNSIEQGYPNNSQSFKKKSVINLMGVKNYDN